MRAVGRRGRKGGQSDEDGGGVVERRGDGGGGIPWGYGEMDLAECDLDVGVVFADAVKNGRRFREGEENQQVLFRRSWGSATHYTGRGCQI